jgi:S-(hydroxymethyl)glutathione synthase
LDFLRPDSSMLSAEHIFILKPCGDGGCHLLHNEIFTGTLVEQMWPGITVNGRKAYNDMNVALKKRVESMEMVSISLHPSVDGGINRGETEFKGAMLRCHCASDPVAVSLREPCSHNHLCGCSKCWKPAGALFAQVAVVPRGTIDVIDNAQKLHVIDNTQSIKRYACGECGTHLFGRVDDKQHHLYGVDFIHPELSTNTGWPAPEFAAFVSSIIEAGTNASHMHAVRGRIKALGLDAYDAFSPELMDVIAYHKVKMANR